MPEPYVDEDRCVAAGLNPRQVMSLARRLSRAAVEARKLGLTVFGGSGTGTLRLMGKGATGDVCTLDGSFDGGDGGDA